MKTAIVQLVGGCFFTCLAAAGPLEDAEAELKTCNSRLNSIFKQVSSVVLGITASPRHQQLLIQSQYAWEQYREAQANFEAFGFSSRGDGFRAAYLRTSIKLVNERTKYLERHLEPIQY